jgi:hypothetical protein
MIKIIEVLLTFPERMANCLSINILGFSTNAEVAVLNWTLSNKEWVKLNNMLPQYSYVEPMAQGSVTLTKEEYESWGSDNGYIEDLVIEKLGLERDFSEDSEPVQEPVAEPVADSPKV